MYVYNFDPETRAYLGGTPHDFDQLDPGRALVPAFSMLTPAPAGSLERAGFWPFANAAGDGWEVRELPKPIEPAPPTTEEMRRQFQAHMQAAKELLEKINAGAGETSIG